MCLFSKKKENISFRLTKLGDSLLGDLILGKKTYKNAMQCVLYNEEKKILIGDICVENNNYMKQINKGYGTLMMNELIKYAKENNYVRIVGNFGVADENSPEDPSHRERQIHFYKKFGFKILPDESSPETMELTL